MPDLCKSRHSRRSVFFSLLKSALSFRKNPNFCQITFPLIYFFSDWEFVETKSWVFKLRYFSEDSLDRIIILVLSNIFAPVPSLAKIKKDFAYSLGFILKCLFFPLLMTTQFLTSLLKLSKLLALYSVIVS